jgi:D-xylulose reductase
MKALVLEKKGALRLRDIELPEILGPRDVKIKPQWVGICGSDIHYYLHGSIGNFVVEQPMVLGHEASGIVVDVGADVTDLAVGDRVCMEPGIPDPQSIEFKNGIYNLDPQVKFWATPPVHGCMRETVVHPAQFTFKLPDTVTLEEGALVEPVAIGVHASKKAAIQPGQNALILGAGTIGIVTALAAAASGCGEVCITDIDAGKLEKVSGLFPEKLRTVSQKDLSSFENKFDIVFEASGSPKAIAAMHSYVSPGGTIVLIGMPPAPAVIDIVGIEVKEITIQSVFRYAHVFDKTIAMMASKRIDVLPLVTHKYPFEKSIQAYDFAASMPADAIKVLISLNE